MINLRHVLCVLVAFSSLFLTWKHGIAWMNDGGNILDPVTFFADGIFANHAASFLGIDILAVWIVYLIWVIPDAIRIGLGWKKGLFFFLLSYLGTCFAFPLYLVVRERFLDKQERFS